MNALFLRYGSTDGDLSVSHTVATLDARATFTELRRIVRVMGEHDARWLAEADGHIDRLVEVLTDTLRACDGMVDGSNYANIVQQRDEAVETAEEAKSDSDEHERRANEAEEELHKLQAAADAAPEELLSKYTKALKDLATKEARIDILNGKVVRAEKQAARIDTAFRTAHRRAARSKAAQEALRVAEDEIRKAAAT